MANPAENAVLRSQEFYRLKQIVQSPGDIYEIDESTKAIYIGPDSDIGEILLTYFNPESPLAIETAKIAVNGPFVGRVDALLQTRIPSTGQPARLLVSPVDIVDNAYTPPASLAFRRFNIPAIIDMIAALKELPAIPETRADRTLRLSSVPYEADPVAPPADDGSTDILIPIYGRRMATIQVFANDATIRVALVNLLPGQNNAERVLGTIVLPATIPVVPLNATIVYRASDAARVGINDPDGAPVPYIEADSVGLTGISLTSVAPRGMADLLYINILSGGVGAGTRFADVYVKITDRED